jgi:hypothetical protein
MKLARFYNWPMLFGIVGTIVWAVFLAPQLSHVFCNLSSLAPNELGDFLAGAFAPLAFLWIVVGYLLQVHALRIQSKELENQISSSRELIKAELDRNRRDIARSQPRFMQASIGGGPKPEHFTLRNAGKTAYDICLGEVRGELKLHDYKSKEIRFDVQVQFRPIDSLPGRFRLDYVDEYGDNHFVWIEFTGKSLVVQPFDTE